MSWDRKRNQQRYYYRSRRIGVQVKKEYVGRGPQAEKMARLDAEKRIQRQTERHAWEKVLTRLEEFRRPLLILENQVNLLMQAMLLLTGHYLHKGHEWRRRGRRADD